MGFFKNIFKGRDNKHGFDYRLVLDIGTEYLKATIVESNKDEMNILGFGRVRQDYGNMDGGSITNINGVVKKARQAIEMAKSNTPHKPRTVVCGLAGEFIKGVLITLDHRRKQPDRLITEKEIAELINAGKGKALKEAQKRTREDTGLEDIKLEMLNFSIVEIKVDGYRVNNPSQFQGAHLKLTVFYSFAPLVQLGALRTIARNLGYNLLGIVAEPYAIANSIMTSESYTFGAVIIDIGGGTTDIALIRNGGIEGTRMFAMGGRAFTRTLASNLKTTLREAEKIKLAYSHGEKVKDYEKVDRLIKSDLQLLYQGIELSLKDLARGEVLPKNIYFCGGGSSLKGLISGFKKINFAEKLPFMKDPHISLLKGNAIDIINDETGQLKGSEHTTPRALSYIATKISQEERSMIHFESQRL